MIIVTGGAGFIGSNFVLEWLKTQGEPVVNLDTLTYCGNLQNLTSIQQDPRHFFVKGDIGDRHLVNGILKKFRPRAIVHFAAETHVDRSIASAEPFLRTNVMGTFSLLEESLAYWKTLDDETRARFRFLHVSTDEVYGSLEPDDPPFTEDHPYAPNSPYSASKAASDHLVRAYHSTYGLPTLVTHCTNNYGPFQFPEKLIPLVVANGLEGKDLPLYGDGLQERNWLYVLDHCEALRLVLDKGAPGSQYLIGGGRSRSNRDIVMIICGLLDEMVGSCAGGPHAALVRHIKDRPGHDRRYDVDTNKIRLELGWQPKVSLEDGLRSTVRWMLDNRDWVDNVKSGEYLHWIDQHYSSHQTPMMAKERS